MLSMYVCTPYLQWRSIWNLLEHYAVRQHRTYWIHASSLRLILPGTPYVRATQVRFTLHQPEMVTSTSSVDGDGEHETVPSSRVPLAILKIVFPKRIGTRSADQRVHTPWTGSTT